MVPAPEPHARDGSRLLFSAARLVQRLQEDALAPLGLTRAAVIALEAVAPRPMNQEQLAAKVHVRSQSLGRVLGRLEEEGLVTRTRNPADRRQFQVQITAAGNAALETASHARSAAVPTDFEGWDSLLEQLARFLEFFETSQGQTARASEAPQHLKSFNPDVNPPAA